MLVCLDSNNAKKHLKCQIQEQLLASSCYYNLPQMWIMSHIVTASEIKVKPNNVSPSTDMSPNDTEVWGSSSHFTGEKEDTW